MNRKEERAIFENSIKENPRDFVTYKIFADWLEEYGENQSDNDLATWLRWWNEERQDAKEWLEDVASKAGLHCTNYSKNFQQYLEETRGLSYQNDRERLEEIRERLGSQEEWIPITYEMLIQIGYDWLNTYDKEWGGDHFVQRGQEGPSDDFDPKFWECWSLVTGVEIDEEKRSSLLLLLLARPYTKVFPLAFS